MMKKILSLLLFLNLISCHTEEDKTVTQTDTVKAYELRKTFPVSPEKLYNALLDSTVLKKIWGVQSITVDAKIGGQTKAVYIEGGQDWSFTIFYMEIWPNQKLKWITYFKNFPKKETHVTLFFKKEGTGSELTVKMENFETTEERDANKQAWEHGLMVLDSLLK